MMVAVVARPPSWAAPARPGCVPEEQFVTVELAIGSQDGLAGDVHRVQRRGGPA